MSFGKMNTFVDTIFTVSVKVCHLLDLWEYHKQFLGISKPKRELTIDEVIPYGI